MGGETDSRNDRRRRRECPCNAGPVLSMHCERLHPQKPQEASPASQQRVHGTTGFGMMRPRESESISRFRTGPPMRGTKESRWGELFGQKQRYKCEGEDRCPPGKLDHLEEVEPPPPHRRPQEDISEPPGPLPQTPGVLRQSVAQTTRSPPNPRAHLEILPSLRGAASDAALRFPSFLRTGVHRSEALGDPLPLLLRIAILRQLRSMERPGFGTIIAHLECDRRLTIPALHKPHPVQGVVKDFPELFRVSQRFISS